MPNPDLAKLIADRLKTGIVHPGDEATGTKPRTIALPFGMKAGQPQEMQDLMDASATMLAEAVIHVIETDGDCEIIGRDEVDALRVAEPEVASTVAVHCRCDPRGTPLMVLTMTHPGRAVVDGSALIRGLSKRTVHCPHERG